MTTWKKRFEKFIHQETTEGHFIETCEVDIEDLKDFFSSEREALLKELMEEMPGVLDAICPHKGKAHSDGFACGWNDHTKKVQALIEKKI